LPEAKGTSIVDALNATTKVSAVRQKETPERCHVLILREPMTVESGRNRKNTQICVLRLEQILPIELRRTSSLLFLPLPAFWNSGRRWTDRRRPTPKSIRGLEVPLHQLLRVHVYGHDDFLGECQFVRNPANRFAETADCVGPHKYLVSIVALGTFDGRRYDRMHRGRSV
jgi:hypothetical protein